jgi:hypothetical protein
LIPFSTILRLKDEIKLYLNAQNANTVLGFLFCALTLRSNKLVDLNLKRLVDLHVAWSV